MSIPFFEEKENSWIEGLVRIANNHQSIHAGEGLFVPHHDRQQELVNDKPTEEEIYPKVIDFSEFGKPQDFSRPTEPNFSSAVIAVDAGVVKIGELTSGGTVFAVRGASVCYPPKDEKPFVCRYNTGVLVIDQNNMFPLFHYMGKRLGKHDQFVKVLSKAPYYKAKSGMTETSNQIQDRCRNFVERIIQEEAIAILDYYKGGILLIDGALSSRTYDTPETYLPNLLSFCRNHNINVVAISKKTRITVGGRPIFHLFDEQKGFIGYAPLSSLLEKERQAAGGNKQSVRKAQDLSVAEEIYAVRFSYAPPGLTFRADVHSALGCLAPEVLSQVYSRCQIYGGYPRPLIEAHQYSSFLYQDVQLLLVDAIVRLDVRPQEEPSMEVLFQPFGGSYK